MHLGMGGPVNSHLSWRQRQCGRQHGFKVSICVPFVISQE
jgi:hypothetical protein